MNGFGIEFLGLPGSGKSTLANRLIQGLGHAEAPRVTVRTAGREALRQRLRASSAPFTRLLMYAAGAALLRGVYPATKYEIAAYNAFCLGHPDLTLAALRAINRTTTDGTRREQAAKLWFKHCARYQLINDHWGSPRDVLAPEGFFQKAITLFISDAPPVPELIDAYVANAPMPAVLVVTAVDPAVALQRLHERQRQPPLAGVTHQQQLDTLRSWAKLQDHLSNMATAGGVEVIMIDAGQPLADNQRLLARRLGA
ncbi:AAA family ATPase [Aquisalimonas sp.]|uniref:AAA family ATPase n=1 Tax=Aquisalimonas sp. TaxID=1872621 RepID=UPI0025C18FC9|nr:AAA family ATPase [Aquisalimonas sp.]